MTGSRIRVTFEYEPHVPPGQRASKLRQKRSVDVEVYALQPMRSVHEDERHHGELTLAYRPAFVDLVTSDAQRFWEMVVQLGETEEQFGHADSHTPNAPWRDEGDWHG